jgi:AMP-binding enzyme
VADPEKFPDGWLRTGDVGTINPDGFLTLVDRSKDIIKSGKRQLVDARVGDQGLADPAALPGDGPPHRSQAPIPVRYASVDTATRGSTAR